MPAHYLIGLEICVLLQNILKIHPQGMATLKKCDPITAQEVNIKGREKSTQFDVTMLKQCV